ncbi:MAG: rhodanese-like domain-containing protein [Ignavibacteria bacterium]
MKRIPWSIGAGLVIVAGAVLFSQVSKHAATVSVEEAQKLITSDSTVVVLDVRTPKEFTGELGHIDGAMLIPVQELEERIGELEKVKGKRVLAICRTGRRSAAAAEILSKQGFHALNVEGGMVKWVEEGLPIVKEK